MSPKISIIMPVYNGENYLAKAIESVLAQDYPHKEIILVNDGSTDQTEAVMQKFIPQVRYVNQVNKGLGASRNSAIKEASGEFYAFLDHDDLWESDKLSAQMQYYQAHQALDPLIFTQVKQFICPSLSAEEQAKVQVNQNPMPGYIAGTMLISKKRFAQIGYFVEQKILGEFIDWYLRVIEQDIPVLMLNQVGLRRRVHDNNMGRQLDLYKRTDYLRVLKASLDRRRKQVSAMGV